MNPRKAAYFSVSDKTGVVDFAFKLSELGYSIIASGGTASLLKQSELQIEELPLGDPRLFTEPMEIVVVNLYPLAEILKEGQATQPEVFELLDVHAASILRGAAKNFTHAVPLCDPDDYPAILEALEGL